MAGHSKWANIQHRKGRQDIKRGKIFTRLIREITVAARLAGGDPALNPRLRLAMDKASDQNMQKDTVERAVKRGIGELEGVRYEEVRYEGYGLGGAALVIDAMTDNPVRTVAEVRHAITKHGGNLGVEGSALFLFQHCGQLVLAPGCNEEKVMELALEAGAEDIITDTDGSIEIICPPPLFTSVQNKIQEAGLCPVLAEITLRPINSVEVSGDDAIKMQKILDALEDLDDVQSVYTTALLESI